MQANTVTKKPQTKVEIKTLESWRDFVIKHWKSLKKKAEVAQLETPYAELVYITFVPILPASKPQLTVLLKILGKIRYCEALKKRIATIYDHEGFNLSSVQFVNHHLSIGELSPDEQTGLDYLMVMTGSLSGLKTTLPGTEKFLSKLQKDFVDHGTPSAVRVQAGMISAGQNVVFAGQDVHIITRNYKGDKVALRAYLAQVRSEWNIPATNIHPRADVHSNYVLHELFTPPDAWMDTADYVEIDVQQLTQRRFEAIEKDLNDARQPVLEIVAINPLVVITGGAGTGKSSLCHFLATALAYACDPKAEKKDGVDGLSLLGPAWIHGAVLPLVVSLRDFCNDADVFPQSRHNASATHLLEYVKKRVGSFGSHLEAYLTQTDVETHGTLLILDGLDEVYVEKHRIILRQIIENWASRFGHCRIMITSRTYAYRHDARWRLSEKFKSVELAPFTWSQMHHYVECWYQQAAQTRPGSFGGGSVALVQAQVMAKNLIKTIVDNKSLWALARQPLMLALLTLIHEDYKHLPGKRAELYEQTVDLLDRWNIPSAVDTLHEKLSGINLERMRAALKHIAYDLQSRQKSFERYPTTIERGKLLEKLMQQQTYGEGLGANIEHVLEYLETRNGIIVSDTAGIFRFPHLSIQEYLAACALIEFYDECAMPGEIKPSNTEGWTFPENIVVLLKNDPYRWRQVALFAGSIIAADKGQDLRWQLIDELLPLEIGETIPEADLHNICIASEIWTESWLKPRKRAQVAIRQHLKKCLQAIKQDERIDAPERMKNMTVLANLKTES